MKVQCPCGSKYAIDVTPEMARDPVRFICPECNTDLSGPINELIRQELGLAPAPAPVVAPLPVAVAIPAGAAPVPVAASVAPISIPPTAPRPVAPPAAPVAAPTAPRLSIARSASAATHGTATEAPAQAATTGETGQPCPKHRGETIIEHCYVCQKPLCPKCMEIFGYVCSPLCKARAESHGINVPVFAGQRSEREAQEWRKKGLIGAAIAAVVLGLVGVWGWYTFYASRPHSIFSVRFPDLAYGGGSQIATNKQIVFLHGWILARYPLGSKKPVWTNELMTQEQFEAAVDREMKGMADESAREARMGVDSEYRMKARQRYEVEKDLQVEMQEAYSLFVQGQNIWVARGSKLTRYDWDTGKAGQQVDMPNEYSRPKTEGGELLFTEQNEFGQHIITHIDLASGETHKETIGEPVQSALLAAASKSAKGKKDTTGAGLPTQPGGKDADKPLDPKKVAQDAQKLSYPAKVALPATLANTMHQNQVLRQIKNDEADPKLSDEEELLYSRSFVLSKYGNVEWSQKLLEAKSISHTAVKAAPAAPKKSVLDSNPTAGDSMKLANEMLNQMQRDVGGDVETEDVSRYQVTVHRPDAKDVQDWTGEVIGEPKVFEQKTVTIIGGGSSVTVIDKSNKKLWQADLPHKFSGGWGFEREDLSERSTGEGPCIERDDSLYVFDEATLTAFDLSNGNVRWRVPSIGIRGIFFDGQGSMYVNSTTADLESIKYSRQININKRTDEAVLKVDCKSGKVLWTVKPGGYVSHVEGKYVLCFASQQGNEMDTDSLTTLPGMVTTSVMDIRRLDPKSGKTVFDYVEERAPLSVRFHGNIIELVFRKEVEVLKFISL
jgi:hypothetical protein